MSDRPGVRFQKIYRFTVRIYPLGAKDLTKIAGTGIIVSPMGDIITCAHVARDALHKHPSEASGGAVSIYCPQLDLSPSEKWFQAVVGACLSSNYEDDAVLLRLTGSVDWITPDMIAVLGPAEESENHLFRSYGYAALHSRLRDFESRYIRGHIEGPVDVPVSDGRYLIARPIQLRTSEIRKGMSGAGVLDTERNLVVGLVSGRWVAARGSGDNDMGWAVDAEVLAQRPFGLTLRDSSLPLQPGIQSRVPVEDACALARTSLKPQLDRAPAPLTDWVGREDLLAQITDDWRNLGIRVVSLIGFGGAGKSSLARKWVDELLNRFCRSGNDVLCPSGVFWWGFYQDSNTDQFFEAAFNYLTETVGKPADNTSTSYQAAQVGAMLGAGRYLFVLDGLEVLQSQELDNYGFVLNQDLREFLEMFARGGHESLCLITSRSDVADLGDYSTHRWHLIERLSQNEGRRLLEKLGVEGSSAKLNQVVAAWDGHALSLSLLGTLCREHYDGNVDRLLEITPPELDVTQDVRVASVLRRYDRLLTDADRTLLTVMSAFRSVVHSSAFDTVFRAAGEISPSYSDLDDVVRLVRYGLLRRFSLKGQNSYSMHPLIRSHYQSLLFAHDPTVVRQLHSAIKEYYLGTAGMLLEYPTLDDLGPLIEAVHHACQAGEYDLAYNIYLNQIEQGRERCIMGYSLGAYDANLTVLRDFFPGRDLEYDPKVSSNHAKSYLLNDVGVCMVNLGFLPDGAKFYLRSAEIDHKENNIAGLSSLYSNLAEVYYYMGVLSKAAEFADGAADFAEQAADLEAIWTAHACRAWIASLRGDFTKAADAYEAAKAAHATLDPEAPYMQDLWGVWMAEYLRRTGHLREAQAMASYNLKHAQEEQRLPEASWWHTVLAEIEAATGHSEQARDHYNSAVRMARAMADRVNVVDALTARGEWMARGGGDARAALDDLEEARGIAVSTKYALKEVDVRIALAWARLANRQPQEAKEEAQRALTNSQKMGYQWGQVDAAAILAVLADNR